jgi:hypothetical protein
MAVATGEVVGLDSDDDDFAYEEVEVARCRNVVDMLV